MGLFGNLFKREDKKEYDARYNHVLSDEDREFAAMIRKNKAEINQKEKELRLKTLQLEQEYKQKELEAKIAELNEQMSDSDDYDDGEENGGSDIDKILLAALMPMISKMTTNNSVGANNSPSPPTNVSLNAPAELSKEELQDYWNKVPYMTKKFIKSLNEEQLLQQLKQRFPNYSDTTYNNAIDIVHKK